MSFSGTVLVSGLHSGPNPSPGVGVARSLREAFPHLALVGICYSGLESGAAASEFDDLIAFPTWAEMELDLWRDTLADRLRAGDAFVPGLDLECHLLAECDTPASVLSPPVEALHAIQKPGCAAAATLGVRVPPSLRMPRSSREIAAFLRTAPSAWVKGANYEATKVDGWIEARRALGAVADTWGDQGSFIQRHIPGTEHSIVFTAHRGELLGCAAMRKTQTTETGKTWAGTVTEPNRRDFERTRRFVAENNWHGGGEIELTRDRAGVDWLLEVNPRFPAWIYGTSIAGVNLPALLLESAGAGTPSRRSSTNPSFQRIVVEIPSGNGLTKAPLVAEHPVDQPRSAGGKHPSGMPMLARRLHSRHRGWPRVEASAAGDPASAALHQHIPSPLPTPHRLPLGGAFPRTVLDVGQRLAAAGLAIEIAYSVKTNPSPPMLAEARELGLLAECTSQDEAATASRAGFPASRIVLNGPAKWWPERRTGQVGVCFADSIDELARLAADSTGTPPAETPGVRLRPARVESRFGVPLDSHASMSRLADALRPLAVSAGGFGIHFHLDVSGIGRAMWEAEAHRAIRIGEALEVLLDVPLRMIDVGGGWAADDIVEFCDALAGVVAAASRRLGADVRWLAEPGKMLLTSSSAVVTRVLDRRAVGDDMEVVVDACIADIPTAATFPHAVYRNVGGDDWQELSVGGGSLLGRSCMEHDILGERLDLSRVQVGELLLIAGTGSYDTSMAYSFGRGAVS